MGAGNLLAIRADERAQSGRIAGAGDVSLKTRARYPARLVVAGARPLVPFVLPIAADTKFVWSSASTFLALFPLGCVRGLLGRDPW
jgi:hypothetical protein